MNNFVFYSPTEFVFGKDTEGQTGTLAKKYNARKVMIVYRWQCCRDAYQRADRG